MWSSPDLVSWQLASVVLPQDTPSPPSAWEECWATDGATDGKGSYFFYLSLGGDQVGVMNASGPAGPWTNALGAPLLSAALGKSLNPPTTIRDPCVFRDVDGSHYIVFGVFTYYMAKLNEDLMSLAEAPRLITVLNPTGPYGNSTDDKPFMHTRAGVYYLSWGCFYAMSASVYGPYTYAGSVIDTASIAPSFRMNDTVGPWYSHQDYADRHGSFWFANGQWYYSSNDRSHSSDLAHRDVFRDTVVGYLHYYENGTMAPVVIDETGVGEYRAGARIEAENFFSLRGGAATRVATDGAGSFGVHGVTAETVLAYPHIRGAPAAGAATLELYAAASGAPAGARVEAHLDAADGPLLCRAALPRTASWEAYATARCALAMPGGAPLPDDFTLVVTFPNNGEGELARIDAIAVL